MSAVDPKHYQHGAYETIIKMIAILGPEKTKAFCDGCVFKYTDRRSDRNQSHDRPGAKPGQKRGKGQAAA